MISILFQDDDDTIRDIFKELLSCHGFMVKTTSHGLEGLEVLHNYKPDLIITDINMPKMNGIDFVKELEKSKKTTKIYLISAHEDNLITDSFEFAQILHRFKKPVAINRMIKKIKEDFKI